MKMDQNGAYVVLHIDPPGILAGTVFSLSCQVQYDPTTILGRGIKCLVAPNPCSAMAVGLSSDCWSVS